MLQALIGPVSGLLDKFIEDKEKNHIENYKALQIQ